MADCIGVCVQHNCEQQYQSNAIHTVGWVFPTPSAEKRKMFHWTGDMLEERQHADFSMREIQGRRVKGKAQMYKLLTQKICQFGTLILGSFLGQVIN